ELLAAASGKTKREVQELLAALAPRPDTPDTIRKLPEPAAPPPEALALSAARPPLSAPSASPPPPTRRQSITPLSPGRYEICFTASASTKDKLKQAQELLRHAVPSGDYGEIFDRRSACSSRTWSARSAGPPIGRGPAGEPRPAL